MIIFRNKLNKIVDIKLKRDTDATRNFDLQVEHVESKDIIRQIELTVVLGFCMYFCVLFFVDIVKWNYEVKLFVILLNIYIWIRGFIKFLIDDEFDIFYNNSRENIAKYIIEEYPRRFKSDRKTLGNLNILFDYFNFLYDFERLDRNGDYKKYEKTIEKYLTYFEYLNGEIDYNDENFLLPFNLHFKNLPKNIRYTQHISKYEKEIIMAFLDKLTSSMEDNLTLIS